MISSAEQSSDFASEFANRFFELAQQRGSVDLARVLYFPTASLATEVVANYLRVNNLSAAVIEPAFGNLGDILYRHRLTLEPLREDRLRAVGVAEMLKELRAEALFLIIPNNPTGYVISESDFRYVVDFCIRENKLLILDFCFRFYSDELLKWRQYDLLEESGIRYIAIEDTGKTWPAFQLKTGLLTSDRVTFKRLREIYADFIVPPSPLTLGILGELIQATQEQGLERSVQSLPRANRDLLRLIIRNAPLSPIGLPTTTVEWIRIEANVIDEELVRRLEAHGILVFPGRYYFWHNPAAGSQFIRVALMRDNALFARGMDQLDRVLPLVL